MGKVLSVISSRASKPLKNFAVEIRAEQVISRDKPIPAPWHPSTKKQIEKLIEENAEMFSKEETKDPKLDEHLKNIYVTSREPELQETLQNKNISRPLPMNRENVTSPEMGYHEPVRVTKGRLSIRQAMELIKKHQQDPETNTPSRLAQEFTINPTSAENIIQYFKPFEYHGPTSKINLNQIGVQDNNRSQKSLPDAKNSES